MNTVKLTHEKLSVDEATQVVTAPTCGAVSIFVGTTRDNFEGKKVIQLEYEAYDSMAKKVMLELCNEIRSKWTVENIAIFHRLGIVPVCEASVIIAVSSEHRTEALAAVQHAIHALKASVPIWKKEVYDQASGSESQWKENKESTVIPTSALKIEANNLGELSNEPNFVHPNLIQIKATPDEVRRRIVSFTSRKREEVNRINVRDFCTQNWQHSSTLKDTKDAAETCARVDAILVPRKDCRSHLRVRRVHNTWGPQTRGIDPGSMPSTYSQFQVKKQDVRRDVEDVPSGIAERLGNIEDHIGIIGPVPSDIYSRLKRAEEKILYLESISPEYFSPLILSTTQSTNPVPREQNTCKKKKVYTPSELMKKLHQLENSNIT